MKKYFTLSVATLSLLLLCACSNKKQTESSSSRVSSSKTSSSSSKSSSSKKVEKTDIKLYDSILDMYAQAIQNPKANQQNQEINWIVSQANIHPQVYSGVFYSYYDLDKNGTEELIVAMGRVNADVKYDLLDIYTIDDQKPLRLTNKENQLDMIGERMILAPLEDGSFLYRGASSATEAQYIHYNFNQKGNALEKVAEGASQDSLGQLPAFLDLSILDWKVLGKTETNTESSTSSMDEEAIKNGDYSSIVGTWKSGTGNTLVFDANGLVSETQHLSEYGARDMYGFVSIGVLPKQGAGGYVIAFIPKGKDYTITNAGETYKDASDHDRDRIWAGQGLGTNTDPNSFYYKID